MGGRIGQADPVTRCAGLCRRTARSMSSMERGAPSRVNVCGADVSVDSPVEVHWAPSLSFLCVDRLENLISRFEEPSSAARWDSPLITIPHFEASLCQVPPDSEEGVHGSPDAVRIWEAISTGDIKPPNVATLPVRRFRLVHVAQQLTHLFRSLLSTADTSWHNIIPHPSRVYDLHSHLDPPLATVALSALRTHNPRPADDTTSSCGTHHQQGSIDADASTPEATVFETEPADGQGVDGGSDCEAVCRLPNGCNPVGSNLPRQAVHIHACTDEHALGTWFRKGEEKVRSSVAGRPCRLHAATGAHNGNLNGAEMSHHFSVKPELRPAALFLLEPIAQGRGAWPRTTTVTRDRRLPALPIAQLAAGVALTYLHVQRQPNSEGF